MAEGKFDKLDFHGNYYGDLSYVQSTSSSRRCTDLFSQKSHPSPCKQRAAVAGPI